MHLAVHIRRFRRGAAWLGLVALLGITAVTLSQCRMIDERLTGVEVTRVRPGECIAQCAHAAAEALKIESERHVAAVQACNGDPVCLATEELTHEQNIMSIQTERKACQDGCHHQGGGSGGR